MIYVSLPSYSNFYDAATDTQFAAVLDRRIGCYVAVAALDDAAAEHFAGNPAFELLTEDEYAQMTTLPAAPEPAPSSTGDPLSDKADSTDLAATLTENVRKNAELRADLLAGPPAPDSK